MEYDVAIIGGGPAGMMAAGRAGELGARVILLETNKALGIKLLITGNGRCNFTNKIDDVRELVKRFGKNGKFLFSSLNKFGVAEVIEFFEKRGVKIKAEKDSRVFPVSDKARDILEALINYLKESNVKVRTNAEVKKIMSKNNKIEKLVLTDGEEIFAKKFIICTGGKSYPLTGSTGDGYKWLKQLGHSLVATRPALTSVIVKENFVKKLEGLSLKDVKIGLFKNGKKVASEFGDAIFTRDGMSGPVILNLSRMIDAEFKDKTKLVIDFFPALDHKTLDQTIQKIFENQNNKIFRNSLGEFLAPKLITVIAELAGIDGEKKVNLITREERKKIIHLIQEFTLSVKSLAGYEKAMITAGGVDLSEVDPKIMKSKIIDNLYFAGEILDLDGPTGGYNLQICWSTGYAAGSSVI